MPEIKQSEIIKWLFGSLVSLGIAFACFAYGQLSVRVDSLEVAVMDIKLENTRMVETMKWLENMKEDYIKANGKFNFDNFLGQLLTSVDK